MQNNRTIETKANNKKIMEIERKKKYKTQSVVCNERDQT